jgi:hypothetical protein
MKLDFTKNTLVALTFCLFAFGKAGAQSPVVINEFMASNTMTAADEFGEFNDWIELYNNSGSAVNLGGWILTDNPANLSKWDFPTNTMIPAFGYLIVWADEDSSALGEQLMLINSSGTVLQNITFGAQQTDMGYARSPNGTGNFVIKNPTFKANNDTGISSTNEADRQEMLTIFPNPASSDEVLLRSEKPGQQAVDVFDQLGRRRLQTAFFNEMKLNVEALEAGVYLIKTETSVQKLVIR